MPRSHAQGTATTAGHTGESLAPWEIVDGDAVKGHETWAGCTDGRPAERTAGRCVRCDPGAGTRVASVNWASPASLGVCPRLLEPPTFHHDWATEEEV